MNSFWFLVLRLLLHYFDVACQTNQQASVSFWLRVTLLHITWHIHHCRVMNAMMKLCSTIFW